MSLSIVQNILAGLRAAMGLPNHSTFRRTYGLLSFPSHSPDFFRTRRGGQMQSFRCKKPRNRKDR
jgi:hypothetical protein